MRYYGSDPYEYVEDIEVDGENQIKVIANKNLSAEYDGLDAYDLSVGFDNSLWGVIQTVVSNGKSSKKNVLAYFNRDEAKWYTVADAGTGVNSVAALNQNVIAYSDFAGNLYISSENGPQRDSQYPLNYSSSESVESD